MDKNTTQTTFNNKALEIFPLEEIKQIVAGAGCNRYIKKR